MKKLSFLIILIALIAQVDAHAMGNFAKKIGSASKKFYSTTTVKHHITINPSWTILPMVASAYYTWQNINDLALLQAIRSGSIKYIDKALKNSDINKEYALISMSPLLVSVTNGDTKITAHLLKNPELSKNAISFALNYCEKVYAAVNVLLTNNEKENRPQVKEATDITKSYYLIKNGIFKSIIEQTKTFILDNKNNNSLSKQELESLKNNLHEAIEQLGNAKKSR